MSNNIPDPILRKEKYLAKIAENTAGGGSDPVILQANKNITANGIVNPDSGFDGFAKVTVNVPNTYSAADEGKVVSDGALISQVSTSVTTNDTYDTTYYNEVTVAVPNTYTAQDEGKVVDNGALVSQTSANINTNGTHTTTTNNEVVVAVPNTYTAGDEGKVVNSGALVAQTAYPSTVTQNDTYDTTNYNSITVNVPSGGGSVEEKDVNFYDYDGTCVYSYTKAEFLALTEMPANPDRTSEGLTAQGWNWSFADATAYVTDYGKLDIGQMYITSDGATKIYITLDSNHLSPTIHIARKGATASGTINWGDGNTENFNANSTNSNFPHTYLTPGDYVISVHVTSSGMKAMYLMDDNNNTSFILLGSNITDTKYYKSHISKIYVGENTELIMPFSYCNRIESITLPANSYDYDNKIRQNGLPYSAYIKHVTVPTSVTTIEYASIFTQALTTLSLPNSITSITNGVLSNKPFLKSISIPQQLSSLPTISNCPLLKGIVIPNNPTSIPSGVFNGDYGLEYIKFTAQTPPTADTTAFSELPTYCKIYVPTGTLTAYTTASNYPDPNTYTYIEY